MSILSDRLRELRGSQSQAAMAAPLGIKYQHWAKYERGESAPGAEMLANICRIHACSADWLLGLRASQPPTECPSEPNRQNNQFGVPGEMPTCLKCPLKKKLKAISKLCS